MSLIVDSIFTEWRASLPEGSLYPNTENGYHLFLLKEICLKRGIPENVINNVLLALEAKDEGELSSKEKKKAYDQGLEGKGGNAWGPKGQDKITHRVKKGTLEKLTKSEPLDKKGSDGKTGAQTGGETDGEDDNQKSNDSRDMFDPNLTKTGSSEKSDDQLTPQEEQLTVLRREDDQLVETQLRLFEDDPQDKGGLGTPESRTGETVTVYAAKRIKELMKGGKKYPEAREQIRQELLEMAKRTKTVRQNGKDVVKKALLTKEWVEAGLNCLDWMEKNIGIENLDEVAWDTDEGNELVGSTGHGTSADMFVKTKEGKVIGISLKKSMKVFIVNGGYDKKIGEVVELLGMEEDDLPEEATKDYYNKQRDDIVEIATSFMLTNPDVEEKVCAHVDRLTQDPSYREKVFTSKGLNKREKHN